MTRLDHMNEIYNDIVSMLMQLEQINYRVQMYVNVISKFSDVISVTIYDGGGHLEFDWSLNPSYETLLKLKEVLYANFRHLK